MIFRHPIPPISIYGHLGSSMMVTLRCYGGGGCQNYQQGALDQSYICEESRNQALMSREGECVIQSRLHGQIVSKSHDQQNLAVTENSQFFYHLRNSVNTIAHKKRHFRIAISRGTN